MRDPKVTVLMPVFNSEQYLREAIESILEQTCTNFELLILYDESKDSSLKITKNYQKWDKRVKIVPNQNPKEGLVGALNTGLKEAKGEYIARMDADDISLSERLKKQVEFLKNNPDVGLCGTWVRCIGTHDGIVWEQPTDPGIAKSKLLFCCPVAHPTVMFRRKEFEKFDLHYDNNYVNAEDIDLWDRVAQKLKISNVPEILFLYRTHPQSTGTQNSARQTENSKSVRIRQIKNLGIDPSQNEIDLHERLSNNSYILNEEFLVNTKSWFQKIREKNKSKKIYGKKGLDLVLNEKYADLRKQIESVQTGNKEFSIIRKTVDSVKKILKKKLTKKQADTLADLISKVICLIKIMFNLSKRIFDRVFSSTMNRTESIRVKLGIGTKLDKNISGKFKIGMAILAHERPEYLNLCLNSLFKTKLYNYDITFLINDDGSKNPKVKEIINKLRSKQYKIIRNFTPKGPNCAGAAINKAVRKLMEIDDFNIIGWCDSDALFHPEWLDKTIKICLWAKSHHKNHILGPFSSFNSSDWEFHRILGTYKSPFGNYVVKRQMGMLNYFYFKNDFLKLGFFPENQDDETLMTKKFENLGVRNFCTETSYIEHLGQESVLNQWRIAPVRRASYGMHLEKSNWGYNMEKLSPLAYCQFVKDNHSFRNKLEVKSNLKLDLLIPAINKDVDVLPWTISSVRKYLKHPIGNIYIVGPKHSRLPDFCRKNECIFKDEDCVLPFKISDLKKYNYKTRGYDRTGWMFQQFVKLFSDKICESDHVYVIDADTILVHPQKFEHNGKTILLITEGYHYPYFKTYEKIFGYKGTAKFSFIAHQMLFKTNRLIELRKVIERAYRKPFFEAIMDSIDLYEISSFSEYETYGNWMLKNHSNEIELEYWFNQSLPGDKLKNFKLDAKKFDYQLRSVSFHSYNRNLGKKLINIFKVNFLK